MRHSKASVARWLRGQNRAGRRIAAQAARRPPELDAALRAVDELRRFADASGAVVDPARSERENLAFHLTWRRLRRVFDVG
jgi:hypothetical protein